MLTAKNDDMDKIMGLEYGADDYITKPFNILEVKARIKAIMRRTSARGQIAKPESILESGDMRVDCELLIRNSNKVYSREKLLNLVWGADYPGDVRTVDVHIRRLREKIETNPSEPRYVHTKWGVGYFFRV